MEKLYRKKTTSPGVGYSNSKELFWICRSRQFGSKQRLKEEWISIKWVLKGFARDLALLWKEKGERREREKER